MKLPFLPEFVVFRLASFGILNLPSFLSNFVLTKLSALPAMACFGRISLKTVACYTVDS